MSAKYGSFCSGLKLMCQLPIIIRWWPISSQSILVDEMDLCWTGYRPLFEQIKRNISLLIDAEWCYMRH